jgi:hypothetical protein
VGDHRDLSPIDPPDPGSDPVRWKASDVGAGEEAVFDPALDIEQHREPVADREL